MCCPHGLIARGASYSGCITAVLWPTRDARVRRDGGGEGGGGLGAACGVCARVLSGGCPFCCSNNT